MYANMAIAETFFEDPCVDLGNGDGFVTVGAPLPFIFHARRHPFSVDIDTYWFGDYDIWLENRWNQVTDTHFLGDWSAMSLSWQNRYVPGGGRTILTTVITGVRGSSSPTLDLSSTTIPSSVDWVGFLTISGRATDADGDSVTIIAVLDANPSAGSQIAVYILSGTEFSAPLALIDNGVETGGTHRLDI
jgi:hypothetical protein